MNYFDIIIGLVMLYTAMSIKASLPDSVSAALGSQRRTMRIWFVCLGLISLAQGFGEWTYRYVSKDTLSSAFFIVVVFFAFILSRQLNAAERKG